MSIKLNEYLWMQSYPAVRTLYSKRLKKITMSFVSLQAVNSENQVYPQKTNPAILELLDSSRLQILSITMY